MLPQFILSLDSLEPDPLEYFSLPLIDQFLYEEILRKSLGWRYAVGKKLPLADVLNTNSNKSKGWMVQTERKSKGR